jgi:hypothetical protein
MKSIDDLKDVMEEILVEIQLLRTETYRTRKVISVVNIVNIFTLIALMLLILLK